MKQEMQTNLFIVKNTTARTARIAIFSALSVVGSLIKAPTPIASVAFDSWAGFFTALYFGAIEGAFVCGIGHLATAAVSGFPFGLLHIPIALGMALAGATIGWINKSNKKWAFIPAITVGIVINSTIVFAIAPWLGGFFAAAALVPFLLVGATLNGLAAALTYIAVKGKIKSDN